MDLTPYVDHLREDLAAAAAAGGPEAQAAAERLTYALEPAMRLALMDALSQAAAEITGELDAGSVDVRLRGREPELVVDVPTMPLPVASPAPGGAMAPPAPDRGPAEGSEVGDTEEVVDDTLARITLRLPESVKYRAEELAAKGGHSLNSWIVTVLRAATRERALNVDIDLSSIPFLDPSGPPDRRGSRRMTGWI